MKNKILKFGTTLLACSILSVMPVSAETKSFDFVFRSTKTVSPVNSGYKNDKEQNYYITIEDGNISSTNVLGTRIRRASDNASVSNYVIHKTTKKSKCYPYAAKVNTNTRYLMRGKKDTCSTSSRDLYVWGRVTY